MMPINFWKQEIIVLLMKMRNRKSLGKLQRKLTLNRLHPHKILQDHCSRFCWKIYSPSLKMNTSNWSLKWRRDHAQHGRVRSEERRVGKECRSRWWAYHEKKK